MPGHAASLLLTVAMRLNENYTFEGAADSFDKTLRLSVAFPAFRIVPVRGSKVSVGVGRRESMHRQISRALASLDGGSSVIPGLDKRRVRVHAVAYADYFPERKKKGGLKKTQSLR
ncbi:hypothetical protein TNCV_585581 [Trichonephila clavipes]|nr:hypothetical protein TNCV_585581 [Trichonephila clavipes]